MSETTAKPNERSTNEIILSVLESLVRLHIGNFDRDAPVFDEMHALKEQVFRENEPIPAENASKGAGKLDIPLSGDLADLESDLEDVLDSYRLAQRMCGVQVVKVDEVVCWIGDIQDTLTQPEWRAWGEPRRAAMFSKWTGANALQDAARWLRASLERPADG